MRQQHFARLDELQGLVGQELPGFEPRAGFPF